MFYISILYLNNSTIYQNTWPFYKRKSSGIMNEIDCWQKSFATASTANIEMPTDYCVQNVIRRSGLNIPKRERKKTNLITITNQCGV